MLDKDKQLKFDEGSTNTVTIKSVVMEENDFGSEFVVHIKETIDGKDHFKPSEGLKKKMIELNVSEGDKIDIEKVPPSDKYQYGYFSVQMAANPANKIEMDKYATGEIKAVDSKGPNFSNDDKMDLHELTLRYKDLEEENAQLKKLVAELKKEVAKLKKDQLPF